MSIILIRVCLVETELHSRWCGGDLIIKNENHTRIASFRAECSPTHVSGDSAVATAAALCLLYTACAGWFHAAQRRTAFVACRGHAGARWLLPGASWILSLGALLALHAAVGWELPIWLVLSALAGISTLLVTALAPKWHVLSALVIYGLGLLLVGWVASSLSRGAGA